MAPPHTDGIKILWSISEKTVSSSLRSCVVIHEDMGDNLHFHNIWPTKTTALGDSRETAGESEE